MFCKIFTKPIVTFSCLTAALFLYANNAHAASCDLKNLKFGINQTEIKNLYKFKALDVALQGQASIISGASGICKDLPETAIVEFSLLDNKFVQLLIKNSNQDSSLLNYATKIFGDMDNKEKDTKKIAMGKKIKLGLWSKDNDYSAVYTSYSAGKKEFEKLTITSKKHQDLFAKANATKVKAADEYLQENKLGKYSPDSKDKPGDSDARMQELQDSYNKNDTGKDKKLKENENDRGYHYEN